MGSRFKLWKASDKAFAQVAMRFFGVGKLGLDESSSQARHPDIWLRRQKGMPVITVTAEWARQNRSEREKRVTHELLHQIGLEHGRKPGGLVYSTYPAEDTYSWVVYRNILAWAQSPQNANPRLTIPVKSAKQLDHLFAAEDHLSKAGVRFDTGSSIKGRKAVTRDWELDYSLSGAKIKNPIHPPAVCQDCGKVYKTLKGAHHHVIKTRHIVDHPQFGPYLKELISPPPPGVANPKIKNPGKRSYIYHGTSEGAFRKIRQEGMTGVRNYFADTEQYAQSYADRKGTRERLLRIKRTRDVILDKRTTGGDYIVPRSISPQEIEAKIKGRWIPIQDYVDEKRNIMPVNQVMQKYGNPRSPGLPRGAKGHCPGCGKPVYRGGLFHYHRYWHEKCFRNSNPVLYHGTRESALPSPEKARFGGLHFGTKKAALDRLAHTILVPKGTPRGPSWGARLREEINKERLIKADIRLQKPLGSITKPVTETQLHCMLNVPRLRKKLDGLIARGYDGVIYLNIVEDPGSISYLVFDKGKIKILENKPAYGNPNGKVPPSVLAEIMKVPDVADTARINYWVPSAIGKIYIEGWSDKCITGWGYPKRNSGDIFDQIETFERLTPGILRDKAKDSGLKLVKGGFYPLPKAKKLYGVTWGVFR